MGLETQLGGISLFKVPREIRECEIFNKFLNSSPKNCWVFWAVLPNWSLTTHNYCSTKVEKFASISRLLPYCEGLERSIAPQICRPKTFTLK
jgi:hypothetical protein